MIYNNLFAGINSKNKKQNTQAVHLLRYAVIDRTEYKS